MCPPVIQVTPKGESMLHASFVEKLKQPTQQGSVLQRKCALQLRLTGGQTRSDHRRSGSPVLLESSFSIFPWFHALVSRFRVHWIPGAEKWVWLQPVRC